MRFERCMALDSRADVKPTVRRLCWDEWRKFYTFGQTRDRIEYAALRDRQLSVSSDFDEGDLKVQSTGPSSLDPLSVLAPPPRLLPAVDAGAPPAPAAVVVAVADAGVDAAAAAVAPPAAACAADCEQTWASCRSECQTAPCDTGCSSKYKRCMKRCF